MLSFYMPRGVLLDINRASIIYGKLHLRRKDLSDSAARYIALWIVSQGKRDKISESLLSEMVASNKGGPWDQLCMEYAYKHMKIVDNENPDSLSQSEMLHRIKLISKQIDSAMQDVKLGTPNEDDTLQALDHQGAVEKVLANFPKNAGNHTWESISGISRSKKRRAFADMFVKYFGASMDLFEKTRIGSKSVAFEYLPELMYVLADVVAINEEYTGSRHAIYETITNECFGDAPGKTAFDPCCREFDKQVDFFVPFVTGKKPHLFFSFGHGPKTDNPAFSCIGAFLDVFYAPSIKVKGYDRVLLPPIYDILDTQSFVDRIATPFYKLMIEFCEEVRMSLPIS